MAPRPLSTSANKTSSVDACADEDECLDEVFSADELVALQRWHLIEPSQIGQKTANPLRSIVEVMNVAPNRNKSLIKLHLGDPTTTGALPAHRTVTEAVAGSVSSGKYNGYGPAVGFADVRHALAKHISTKSRQVAADDIVLTSGCSHALQLAIEAIADAGSNVLVPKPGFPLYETISGPLGIEVRKYDLLQDDSWQVDLKHMESLIDSRTAAIIVNNPGNPTGSVYSKQHLEAILRVADKHRVPIIADEIYGDMVYNGAQFYPMHTLEPKVPMLTCDGISKRYLVPGWRLGWIVVSNVDGALDDVLGVICQLARKINGPSSLVQGALPAILNNTPGEFFERTRNVLSANADIVCEELAGVEGLRPVRSYGAMYMMITIDMKRFPEFQDDDVKFIRSLIAEESLYCLPGSAFYYPRSVRFVLAQTPDEMRDACRRLREFCERHYRAAPPPPPPLKARSISEIQLPVQQLISNRFNNFASKINSRKSTKRRQSVGYSRDQPILARQPSYC
jgi:tyrosine aminotransferase